MVEIQDILAKHLSDFIKRYPISFYILKVFNALIKCRTSSLGGHIEKCDSCSHLKISYNSCRNRHCPKCQGAAREQWIQNQQAVLLNTSYFHVVFTIPDELRPLFLGNQKVLYNLLFKAVSQTVLELASDNKYLGAQCGITMLLHTWGQNLSYHPHIHCIIPAGGLSPYGKWVPTRKKFFLPVKVLSRKFRGKLLYFINNAYDENTLNFKGSTADLKNRPSFDSFISSLYKEWVVYSKKPFKDASNLLNYLGRYTHRVAISNSRIITLVDGVVKFKWKDYKDGNKVKVMELSAIEFIRRLSLHILPKRFVKIRHAGFLANRNRITKLKLCQRLTKTKITDALAKLSPIDIIKKLTGVDITVCPCCRLGKMKLISSYGKGPPIESELNMG